MTFKKMNRGWRGESRRHSLSARGIPNAVNPREKAMMKAPLQNKSDYSKIQLAIIVPSTEFDKTISEKDYNDRINETRKFLSDIFGGDTSINAKGGFIEKGNFISEDVVLVETYTNKKDYNKNKVKIEKYIKDK